MPDALGSIGSFFGGSGSAGSGLVDLLGLGTAGSGVIGNILNEKQRSDQINQLKKLENPTTLAKDVSAATQPLNSGLVQSVGNTVSGNLAEQGLSQAPGIQATELSQALAPFEQQNQQTALNLVLARLGIPQSILASLPNNANIAPIIAMLMRQSQGPGGGGAFGSPNPNSSQYDAFFNSLGSYNQSNTSGDTSLFDPSTLTDAPVNFDFSGVNA